MLRGAELAGMGFIHHDSRSLLEKKNWS